MRWLPLALTAALAAPTAAHAAGWTQPEGEFYLKLWDRSLIGSSAYTADGEVVEVGDYQDHQLNAYFEYGLQDVLTLVAFGTPIGYASADSSTAYVGPIGTGVRFGIAQDGPVKLAVELQYALAPGIGDSVLLERPAPSGDPDDRPIIYRPSVTNHRSELQLQLGYGLPFGFVTATVGGRLNSNHDIDHAVLGFLQLGVVPLSRLTILVSASTYQPLGTVVETNVAGVGQTRYIGFGLGLHYLVTDHIGMSLGADGAALVESNAATPSLQAGVDFR